MQKQNFLWPDPSAKMLWIWINRICRKFKEVSHKTKKVILTVRVVWIQSFYGLFFHLSLVRLWVWGLRKAHRKLPLDWCQSQEAGPVLALSRTVSVWIWLQPLSCSHLGRNSTFKVQIKIWPSSCLTKESSCCRHDTLGLPTAGCLPRHALDTNQVAEDERHGQSPLRLSSSTTTILLHETVRPFKEKEYWTRHEIESSKWNQMTFKSETWKK